MTQGAAILGVAGPRLTDAEAALFRAGDPWGFILFARNVEAPDQLRRLTGDLREAVGRDAPILIDQEGGRVQRMRAPHWREFLPALDQMTRARDPLRAQWVRNRLIAADLHAVGIDVNCAPLADLVEEGTHPVLLNRLYGSDVETVVQAAQAVADGLMAGGVLPVLKHLPGYGRAQVDSHLGLPVVDAPLADLEARDFAPFRALTHLPMAMTAHIVLTAVDPDRPATTSPEVIRLIRERIGYQRLLMSDDLGMGALTGTPAERTAATRAAGVDVALFCNGTLVETESVIDAAGCFTPDQQARADAALAWRRAPEAADLAALDAELAALLG